MRGRTDGSWIVRERDGRIRTLTWDLGEARAEITRLRHGLWDVYAALGFDTDGDPTPAALTYPDLVTLVLDAAKEYRAQVEEDA